MARTRACEGCGARTSRIDFCQGCKSKLFHAGKRVRREALVVDQAGGGWWIWDARGEVLVIGRDSKREAICALAEIGGRDGLDVDAIDE